MSNNNIMRSRMWRYLSEIEASSTYQLILEKGQEKGRQETLNEAQQRFGQRITEILSKKFGPVPAALTLVKSALKPPPLTRANAPTPAAQALKMTVFCLRQDWEALKFELPTLEQGAYRFGLIF